MRCVEEKQMAGIGAAGIEGREEKKKNRCPCKERRNGQAAATEGSTRGQVFFFFSDR